MANADYIVRNLNLPLCPRGVIVDAIGELGTTFELINYSSPSSEAIRVGSAALLGDEIVLIVGFADGANLDITYTYRITTTTEGASDIHAEILPPSSGIYYEQGDSFPLTPGANRRLDFAIEVYWISNPENPIKHSLVPGLDFNISADWVLTVLRRWPFIGSNDAIVRAQYTNVTTVNSDYPTVASIPGQNTGTTYTINVFGGSLLSFSHVQYQLPFGGGTVTLMNGVDYSRVGNVITFLQDFRGITNKKTVQIARGCCDTIPQSHPAGTEVWFFDDYLARDDVEYPPTATLAVKPLVKPASGPSVPVEYSPPEEITFNSRFARPYPPAQVKANGSPWFNPVDISGETTQLDLTWVHRNRVTQMDLLVDHTQANVTPEVGQTYTVRVYDDANVLKTTYSGIDAMAWSYTVEQMTSDFAAASTSGVIAGYLMFVSVREGYESLQPYRIDFEFLARSSVESDFIITYDIQ